MIREGTIVTPREQICGMIITYGPGDRLRVKKRSGGECTIEKPDGTGCVVGVPVELLQPIKS